MSVVYICVLGGYSYYRRFH